ncbi:hypothetical protein MGYG_01603 [Nannizzia gypsea CBS 118893]|uniref:Uncharacterized protein n=1 Tax=Arthroderma gypseum (strain ATCC MYA-4604 / CBS 118893) TaxID=535722 RepID=E5R1U3_ARTGP|nr:hypothetical protein MGYG_01603 [Nannizzia gypsea CBS 118893]EFQ98577.1 hypothetical protein MGYG_01603 [Nannizzia gypsea CBS 118893]
MSNEKKNTYNRNHGAQEITMRRRPRDEPGLVNCRWWKKGHCRRGDTCYFRHDPCLQGVDRRADVAAAAAVAAAAGDENGVTTQDAQEPSQPGQPNDSAKEPEQCSICLEVPKVCGLLTDCDHVFCLECIRRWRHSRQGDQNSRNIGRGSRSDDPYAIWGPTTTKSCPLCRKPSKYIIPSAIFPTPSPVTQDASKGIVESETAASSKPIPNGTTLNPLKASIIKEYNRSMKKIPCRYFQTAIKNWEQKVKEATEKGAAEPPFRPGCYFENKCHYAHIDPQTGEPYIFDAALIAEMHRKRLRRENQRRLQNILNEVLLMGVSRREFDYSYLSTSPPPELEAWPISRPDFDESSSTDLESFSLPNWRV